VDIYIFSGEAQSTFACTAAKETSAMRKEHLAILSDCNFSSTTSRAYAQEIEEKFHHVMFLYISITINADLFKYSSISREKG
jgi:hypothetical protein